MNGLPPRLRPRFRLTPGLSRKGGPPLRAGPPFLDLQENRAGQPRRGGGWPEAGRRQSGRSRIGTEDEQGGQGQGRSNSEDACGRWWGRGPGARVSMRSGRSSVKFVVTHGYGSAEAVLAVLPIAGARSFSRSAAGRVRRELDAPPLGPPFRPKASAPMRARRPSLILVWESS